MDNTFYIVIEYTDDSIDVVKLFTDRDWAIRYVNNVCEEYAMQADDEEFEYEIENFLGKNDGDLVYVATSVTEDSFYPLRIEVVKKSVDVE